MEAEATAKRNPEMDALWEDFKTKFNKKYEGNEESIRRAIWEKNMAYIAKHNKDYDLGLSTYKLGINEFSDLTHEEFSKSRLGTNKVVYDIPKNNNDQVLPNKD